MERPTITKELNIDQVRYDYYALWFGEPKSKIGYISLEGWTLAGEKEFLEAMGFENCFIWR